MNRLFLIFKKWIVVIMNILKPLNYILEISELYDI